MTDGTETITRDVGLLRHVRADPNVRVAEVMLEQQAQAFGWADPAPLKAAIDRSIAAYNAKRGDND